MLGFVGSIDQSQIYVTVVLDVDRVLFLPDVVGGYGRLISGELGQGAEADLTQFWPKSLVMNRPSKLPEVLETAA